LGEGDAPHAPTLSRSGRHSLVLLPFLAASLFTLSAVGATVPRFGLHEVQLEAKGAYSNPYTDLTATVLMAAPDARTTRALPMFWDGGATWKFRFSPDRVGVWRWTVDSPDKGLNGQSGKFEVTDSMLPGSIRPMKGHPLHFERQDGTPFWFMGDTAWAMFTDNKEEKHDRDAAHRYVAARAKQGFSVVHSMLIAESGWGNSGGLPFAEIGAEKLNPGYWREVDERLAYANNQGIVVGLALAWADKRKVEPFAWRRFPNLEARKRYARYVAARYAAYDTYFIVSGEWHGEIRTRGSTEDVVRKEFFEIGDALKSSDPHGRMIAIHPMTARGSVREFNQASWMSFGDYQQNYTDLHERILQSRSFNKPVVNAEYGYHLRDQSGDGVPDKDNSTSLDVIRHATWDIVMAGGYFVTGFGTTYFGGNRDPGPFDLDAAKNKDWEKQVGFIRQVMKQFKWWELEPWDLKLKSETPRAGDRRYLGRIAPPQATYWCLGSRDEGVICYVRGVRDTVQIPGDQFPGVMWARLLNPRTGEMNGVDRSTKFPNPVKGGEAFFPPDTNDWVLLFTRQLK
jgi:hypothetical protein